MSESQTATKEPSNQPEFAIGHIYIKDSSFEIATPMHRLSEWKPDAKITRECTYQALENKTYEVQLRVTVSVKSNDEKAFIAEVQQAGSFIINNFSEQQLEHLLESYCPSILLPYLRQALSSSITLGGFPPFFLPPIDFESEYQHKKAAKATS